MTHEQTELRLSVRDRIIAALDGCAHLCCDNEEERGQIADAVLAALAQDDDASTIRALFANAPTMGGRIEVVASHGKRLGALIEAAARLAGCPDAEVR